MHVPRCQSGQSLEGLPCETWSWRGRTGDNPNGSDYLRLDILARIQMVPSGSPQKGVITPAMHGNEGSTQGRDGIEDSH